jgi:MFS family permease
LGANIDVSASTGGFYELAQLPAYFAPLMLLAALFFAAFIAVERRVRDPLLNLKLFRQRSLSAGLVVNLFVGFALVIGLVSVPILVNVRQEDASTLTEAALQVGLLLSTLTIPMALAAVPGGWLGDRIGFRATTLLGLGLALVGYLLLWQTWTLTTPDALIAVQMTLIGVGLGLTFSPISASVINAAPDRERGVASALVIILRLIGMTVSVSALTTIALQRVNALAAAQLGGQIDPMQAANAYAEITVRVLGELGLIGAVACGLALIAALRLGREATPAPEMADMAASSRADH